MKTRVLKLNKLETPKFFWGMVFLLVIFIGFYLYLINKTIWNVAERQRAEKAIDVLSSTTGELEENYMSMKNKIDLNLAQSLGFSPTKITKFINRTTLGRLSDRRVE